MVLRRKTKGGRYQVRFAIVTRRKWFFLLSGTITLAGLIVMLVFGLNLGTDFKSGAQIQVQINHTFHTSSVQQAFSQVGISVPASSITTAGTQSNMAVIRLGNTLTAKQEAAINTALQKEFPKALLPAAFSSVDPVIAQEQSQTAVWAVLLASLGIVIYVAIRFEYRFAVSGIVALLHDAFIVISVFALLRIQVDLPFIAAVLTIVGYSINDTIVIFDRIRENMKNAKVKSLHELEELVDHSLWQTMARSINTVLTVLFAAATLFLFGGDSIHNFTFALLIGLVSGAYSSIFIASPLWVLWRSRTFRKGKRAVA